MEHRQALVALRHFVAMKDGEARQEALTPFRSEWADAYAGAAE